MQQVDEESYEKLVMYHQILRKTKQMNSSMKNVRRQNQEAAHGHVR